MRRALVAVVLLLAACGDAATTTTTAPPATASVDTTTTTAEPTIPPETRPPTTTTTSTTTTIAPTTTTTTVPDVLVPLPDLVVPDRFVDRAIGREDFDANAEVVAEGGDWYLLRSGTESFIPVPAGWDVDDREDATDLSFGILAEGGVEVFTQRDTEDTDIAVLFEDIQSDLEEGDELFVVEINEDENQSYIAGTTIDGDVRIYAVAVLTLRDGALYILSGGADATIWAEFEPLFRAMVAGWHDGVGEPLGPDLPDDFGFPPVDPRNQPPDLPAECAFLIDEALELFQDMLDQLVDVTVDEWNDADGDFTQFVDTEFEEELDALEVQSLDLGCDEDDLAALFVSRFDELQADGEVPALFLDLLQTITI